MRLISLQLIGQFKSLKGTAEEPFEYHFSSPNDNDTGLSPICLVGLNGSGKSNLIELIADIFSYADRYFNKLFDCKRDLGYDFEITYSIVIDEAPRKIQLRCYNSELETFYVKAIDTDFFDDV